MADPKASLLITLKDKISKGLAKIGGKLDKLGKNLDKSKFLFAGLAAGIGAAGAMFLSAASKMESWQISFEVMLGSAEKARLLMAQIKDFAQATPFELPEVIKGTKALLAFGVAQEEVIPTLKMLGDVSAGLGVPMERLILNFGQVKAQAKLTGREMRDFAVAGVPLLATLADQYDVNKAKIQEMVSAGKIGFKDVEKAFAKMSGAGGRFNDLMQRQMTTLPGIISNVKDEIFQLSAELGEKLLPTAKKIAKGIIELINWFRNLSPRVKNTTLIFTGLVGAIAAVLAIAGTLVAFGGTFAAIFAIMTGPIGLLAIALTGLVTTFYFFQEEVLIVLDFIQSLFGVFVETFKEKIDEFKEFLIEVKEWLMEQVTELVDGLLEKWEMLKLGTTIIWEFITRKAKKEFKNVSDENKKAIKTIVKDTTKHWKDMLEKLKKVQADRKAARDKANAEQIASTKKTLAIQQDAHVKAFKEQQNNENKQTKWQKLNNIEKLTVTAGYLDQLSTLQQSKNKSMFAIGKAAAIASATINTYKGVAQAWGYGMPMGPVFAAIVLASGLAQVHRIGATSMAEGGVVMPTQGGTITRIAEAGKPEAVLPLDSEEASEKLNEALGGGTTININADILVADDEGISKLAEMLDNKFYDMQRNNESITF